MGITDQDRRKFVRLAKSLAAYMKELRLRAPEANLYLAMEELHLMEGLSHDSQSEIAQQENSLESVLIPGAGGGDW